MLTSTHRWERAKMAQEQSDDLDAVECCIGNLRATMEVMDRQVGSCTGEAGASLYRAWEMLDNVLSSLVQLRGRLETM